jgi:O-antigen ligase
VNLYYLLLAITPFHADPRVGMVLFAAGIAIVTPAKLVGLLAVVGAFAAAPEPNAAPRLRSSIPILFTPFALLPVIATLVAGLPAPTNTISQLLSAVLLLIATRRLVRTRERLCTVVRILVIAFTLSTLWVYKQHFVEHAAASWGVEGETNYEALMLLVSIPMAFWMGRYESSQRLRIIGFASGLLLCGAVVLTESRAGIMAGGVMGMLATLQSRHKLRNLLLMAFAVFILMNFGPAGLSSRFRSIKFAGQATNGAEESTRIHVELAKAGILMIEAHPLLGVGLDQFKPTAPQYNPEITRLSHQTWLAHDTFVQMGAECGIPVLLLFVAMLGVALRNFQSARRIEDPALAELGLALTLGLIGISIAAFSITVELLPFWLFTFLAPSFREISRLEVSRTAKAKNRGAAPIAARSIEMVGAHALAAP